MANEIDKRMVKWEEESPVAGIDPRLVRWEDERSQMEHRPAPEQPPIPDPMAAAISLGRQADLAAAGLESLFSSPERKTEITEQQAENTRLYAPQQAANPGMDMLGKIGWYSLGRTPLGVATLAGVEHAPTTAQRLANAGEAYIGGKIGQGIGKMVGKAITPAKTVINEAQEEALREGQKLGYKAFPSMKTGSAAQKMIEAGAESNVFATGKVQNIKMWNQSKLNTEFAKAMGVFSDVVDESTVASAITKVNGVYSRIAKPVPAQFNAKTAVGALNSAIAKSRGIVKDFANHELVKDADTLLTQGATKQQLVALATQLRQAAESQFRSATGDRGLAIGLSNVKNVVDDALMEGLAPAEQAALTEARRNWKYILIALKPNVVNTANGNVSGNNLYNTLKEHEIKALVRGSDPSPLVAGAKMEKAFPRAFGSSGTAERLASPSRFGGEFVLNKILYDPYFSDLGMMWAGNRLWNPAMQNFNTIAWTGAGAALGNENLPLLLQPAKQPQQ